MQAREVNPHQTCLCLASARRDAGWSDTLVTVADEPDIIGRDAPERSLPSWLRPVGIVLAVCVAAVSFMASRDDEPAQRAPAVAPPIGPIGGEPGRRCGPPNADGLAWGALSGAVQPDGRVVIWRIHLCNTGNQDLTVTSLRPLSGAERNLPAEQVWALNKDTVVINDSDTQALPVRIPAGEQADVRTVSVVLGCERPDAPSGLRSTLSIAGVSRQVDFPARRPGISPVELWCNEYRRRGATHAAFPVLRDGAVTVAARDSDIDIRVPLFNPNALPLTLTGLISPSPGVGVLSASVVSLQPGGRASVSARLIVESCARVFVDAPWQLAFTGRMEGEAVQVAPVRLGATDWQRDALRQICPSVAALPPATATPELTVSGPQFRGGKTDYQVTQIVRNDSRRTLFLDVHPRSAPGMEFLRAEVIPGGQAALGRTAGAPLRRWSLPPNTSVFVSYFYELGGGTDPVCLAPPIDRFRAPVDVTDAAGRAANVLEELIQAPRTSRAWAGGWLVDSAASCARPVRQGRAAPFLVFASRGDPTDDDQLKYRLTVYGIPGESASTVIGLRLVGAFAHLPIAPDREPGAVSAGQRRVVVATTPIRCPEPGVPITLAVSYRTGSDPDPEPLPVLLELGAPPVLSGRHC